MTKRITVETELVSMLTENTGRAMCDSGDAYGRNWQRNQNKRLKDFMAEPEVSFTPIKWETSEGESIAEVMSNEIEFQVSVFHYLRHQITLDSMGYCKRFNRINRNADDWDSDIYGVSAKGFAYLQSLPGFKVGETENSYNRECNLSQTIQYTACEIDGDSYILLQIHGGCDVRGGYTNARLFMLCEDYLYSETVYGKIINPKLADDPRQLTIGDIELQTGEEQVSTSYDGYSLLNDDGKPVTITEDCEISLGL